MKLLNSRNDLIATFYIPSLIIALVGWILWPMFPFWIASVLSVCIGVGTIWGIRRVYQVPTIPETQVPEWQVGLRVWSTNAIAWIVYFSMLGLFARPMHLSSITVVAFMIVPAFATIIVWACGVVYTQGKRPLRSWNALLPSSQTRSHLNIVFNVSLRMWMLVTLLWLTIVPFYVLAHMFAPNVFALGRVELSWLGLLSFMGIVSTSGRVHRWLRTPLQKWPSIVIIIVGSLGWIVLACFFYWLMFPFSLGFQSLSFVQITSMLSHTLFRLPEIMLWSIGYWGAVVFCLARRYANWFGNRSVWLWILFNPMGIIVGAVWAGVPPAGHILWACMGLCAVLLYVSGAGFQEDVAATFSAKDTPSSMAASRSGLAMRRYLGGILLSGALFPWMGTSIFMWLSLSACLCMIVIGYIWGLQVIRCD